MNNINLIIHTKYHFNQLLAVLFSKCFLYASSFAFLSLSFCYSSNLYFYSPFSSFAFCVAFIAYSRFCLSYSIFFGSDSSLDKSDYIYLNTEIIFAFAFFFIHFLIYYPHLFFSFALTSSNTISFKSSLKIYLIL